MFATKSENLFWNYCLGLGISIRKVKEGEERSADFRLSKSGIDCIAEVKEFSPNQQEKNSIASIEKVGVGTPVGGKPGERVRNKIKAAMPQLRELVNDGEPGLLVLYYNVPGLLGEGCTKPYDILTAMYGLQAVSSLTSSIKHPDKFGGGRSTSLDKNTTLSAIMVIKDHSEEISAKIYHNFYAKNKLPFDFFEGASCENYVLENGSENWFQQFKLVGDDGNA